MLRDCCIYEWQVQFTQTVRHYDDLCQDFSHETKHPGTQVTIRLLADRYADDVADAWLKARFRFEKDAEMTVVSREKQDINGFLISR